jgi:hypothetical protein
MNRFHGEGMFKAEQAAFGTGCTNNEMTIPKETLTEHYSKVFPARFFLTMFLVTRMNSQNAFKFHDRQSPLLRLWQLIG